MGQKGQWGTLVLVRAPRVAHASTSHYLLSSIPQNCAEEARGGGRPISYRIPDNGRLI